MLYDAFAFAIPLKFSLFERYLRMRIGAKKSITAFWMIRVRTAAALNVRVWSNLISLMTGSMITMVRRVSTKRVAQT